MPRPTFGKIPFAYQLRFHFGAQTRYRKPLFREESLRAVVGEHLAQVCEEKGYHLLESRIEPAFLRALVSVRPEHAPSQVAKNLKGVLSRRLQLAQPEAFDTVTGGRLWGDAYFCHSVGRATTEVVEQYLGRQVDHHGYRNEDFKRMRYTFPVPEWEDASGPVLIRYQIVCETEKRRPLFSPEITDKLAPFLGERLPAESKCKLARLSFLPDHAHFGVWAPPSVAPQDAALAIMNLSAGWMLEHYEGSLKFEEAWNTWSSSAYVGTIGEVTSQHVGNYLRCAP